METKQLIFIGTNGMRYSGKFYYVFDNFIYLKVSSGAGNPPLTVLKCVEKQRGIKCTK
ncbi:hypothetical protein [Helicobacter sp.]|uniref:hypothetical protein n=1 Tax=Helicobacter sp. TaxID=218 RepID=UPI0025BCA3A4|nr:hypothetical protein [Helicobacter sp.]MCI5968577.1 hypothetical protein [Helicobacter sp.]MDY2584065.1 hypothetical protein [Helicobacter sp.]